MATSNHIAKVAIIGASGNSGSFMTDALLKTGKHTVTALTRPDSQSQMPQGVITKKVDYSNYESVVEALRGQDALVMTLNGLTPRETHHQLIRAAGEAGVSWILPNEWSPDTDHEGLLKDIMIFPPNPETRKYIAELGKSSFIGISTGFWYEWSLAIEPAFGFDLIERRVTLFDEGETKMSVSTWPQIGRAVAALLSLPIKAEGANKEACLENFKNQLVYINSFTVSQKDMFESALRVTGTKEADWTILKEPSEERYTTAIKDMKEGKRIGFAKMLYTRVFYPDGSGDFESRKGTINGILGLPKEDIDEATKVALERAKLPKWFEGH